MNWNETKYVSFATVSASSASTIPAKNTWTDAKILIDRVQKQVCGHSIFVDIKLLLEFSCAWSSNAEKYLHD